MMRQIFSLSSDWGLTSCRLLVLLVLLLLILWGYATLRISFWGNIGDSFRLRTRMSFLEGILICMVLFALYFGFFITLNEWQCYSWNEFYLDGECIYIMIFPEILVFILINVIFGLVLRNFSKMKCS